MLDGSVSTPTTGVPKKCPHEHVAHINHLGHECLLTLERSGEFLLGFVQIRAKDSHFVFVMGFCRLDLGSNDTKIA